MLTDQQKLENKRASQRKYYQKVKNDPKYTTYARSYRKARYEREKQDPAKVQLWREQGLHHYHAKKQGTARFRQQCVKTTRSWRERKQEIRKQLQALLGSRCIKCGVDDYRLLDFDHLNPTEKKMMISQKLHLPFDELKAEVLKCQLLCANCHRLKTIEQRQFNSRVRAYRNLPKNSSFA